MTDPEATPQDQQAASALAVPGTAADPHGPVTGHDPVGVSRGRRRRRAMLMLAAVVVAGLAAGLVAWAPWTPPPVLRPAGLVAGPSTANSIAFHWSPPRTGPLPDKYLILSSGTVVGLVLGTVTSYRQAGLTPATPYQYRVVAVRGGKRSPQSAPLTVSTLTPPISQARLQGSWKVWAVNTGPAPGGQNGFLDWQFSPTCAVGACDVILRQQDGGFSHKMKLTRAGAAYTGQAVINYSPCGPGASSIPDPLTLEIRIRVTAAAGKGQVWAATFLTGIMAGTYHTVSSASFYCPGSTFKASLTGGPG